MTHDLLATTLRVAIHANHVVAERLVCCGNGVQEYPEGDAAFAVDQQGEIKLWNSEAEKLLGYSASARRSSIACLNAGNGRAPANPSN